MNIKKRLRLLIAGILAIGLLAIAFPSFMSYFGNDNDGLIVGDPVTHPPSQDEPIIEPNPEQEPGEEPDSEKESVEDTEPVEKPIEKPEPNPGEKTGEHMLYAGEQLMIPVSGGSDTNQSIVINSAVLPSNEKQIALTFDAGWLYDQTTDLLYVLDVYQVKSTFFLRGKWAEDHPELAREILKRGHSVESHSLTHGHMREMSDSAVRNEIAATTKIIKDTTGYRPYLFRPPFGEYDSRILNILAQQGYPYTIMWTIDSLDWLEERNGVKVTAQYLTDRILSNATDKGIVLMHVGGYQTVNALPGIIEGLRNAGYSLVKVNDMLPPAPSLGNVTLYTVRQGDTLNSIALQFGISVTDILAANPNR